MKVAIFGVRDAEYVKKQIENNDISDIKVRYFVDNNKDLWDTEILCENKDTVRIISSDELVSKYREREVDFVIIAVRNGYNRWSITEQLKELGISKIGLLKPSVITYKWNIKISQDEQGRYISDQILCLEDVKKPLIHYLEIHASDACNLNCKGCLHFSSLFGKEEKLDNRELLRDIKKLSERCEIFHLRVLGGEPLLNAELKELLVSLRKILPQADIGIVTNGILIPKQEKHLFEVMKENAIGFNITLYPPTHKMKEQIYSVLKENGVSYGSHLAKMDEFSKGLSLKPKTGKITSHTKCVSKNCFFLRNGKLYKCAPEALINRFFETYGISTRIDTGIDIYDERINWEQVISTMYVHPVSLCRYCSDELVDFEWAVANPPRKEDWLVDEQI